MAECLAREIALPRGVRGIELANSTASIVLLPDKGADIYQLVHRPTGIDVLWKSPWGLRRPGGGHFSAANSMEAWIEAYEGGWQLLFPSGGGPCIEQGATLNFHGEASVSAWDVEALEASGDTAECRLSLRLARSLFRVERTVRLAAGDTGPVIRETIVNEGGEPADYMWGHHPAFGAPFLSGSCRIDTNAATLIADQAYDAPGKPMTPGARISWPLAERDGQITDVSRVPAEGSGVASLAYFADYREEAAWYGITNPDLGLGVGLVWSREAFPHAWFWQELHASPGFPWYKGVYVMAIEPNTSYPGAGLVAVREQTGTHRTLQPGDSASADIRVVFFTTRSGVSAIDASGAVTLKEF